MHKISVSGRDISFRELGSGAPMVLLHGYGGSHLDWDVIAVDLAKDFRVYLPNFSTHYLDLKNRLSFMDLVELVGAFVREISAQRGTKVIVAGASFGGALAWALTIRFPDLVEKLVLVSPMPPNPAPRIRDPRMKFLLKLATIPKGVAIFLATPAGHLLLPYLERIFQLPWARHQKNKRWALLTHRKLRIVSHSVERFAWISNATLHMVVGGGHAMTREAPNSVIRETKRFLIPPASSTGQAG